jgi:hypothetical protein
MCYIIYLVVYQPLYSRILDLMRQMPGASKGGITPRVKPQRFALLLMDDIAPKFLKQSILKTRDILCNVPSKEDNISN